MISYPYPADEVVNALERLPHTAYAEDDKPFLSTQRYQLNPDFEISDVDAKALVDLQGAMEMQWSMQQWKERTERNG
jgi:hypothetical protein